MVRSILNLKTVGLIIGLMVCCSGFQACQNEHGTRVAKRRSFPSGQDVVDRYRELEGCHTITMKTNASVREEDGTERDFTITTYQKCVAGAQYTMRHVLASEPSQEESPRALLSIEKPGQPVELVTYLPGFDRFVEVENLSREDSQFGLSIQESLGDYDLYQYRMVEPETVDQVECYKIEGRLKPTASSRFHRTVTYYRQDNALPLQTELYNIKDELVRVRHYRDWSQIDGHWIVMRTVIDNVRYKKQIVFQTVEVHDDADIPDSFFTRENLKKLIADTP